MQANTHCPASKAAALLGDKWTLLILRAMILGGTRYSDFTAAIPRISPSVLSGRLKTLEENGLLVKKGGGGQQASYHLTPSGRECRPLIFFLGRWGLKWAERNIRIDSVDVAGAMWDLHRTLGTDELPDGKTVLSFTLTDIDSHTRWWMIAEGGAVDLCNDDPGCDVDLYIHAPLESLLAIWAGDTSVAAASDEGVLTMTGDVTLSRTADLWFPASPLRGAKQAMAQEEAVQEV